MAGGEIKKKHQKTSWLYSLDVDKWIKLGDLAYPTATAAAKCLVLQVRTGYPLLMSITDLSFKSSFRMPVSLCPLSNTLLLLLKHRNL